MDEQELDPSIAALLAEAERSHQIGETDIDTVQADAAPEEKTDRDAERRGPKGIHDVDLGVKGIPKIVRFSGKISFRRIGNCCAVCRKNRAICICRCPSVCSCVSAFCFRRFLNPNKKIFFPVSYSKTLRTNRSSIWMNGSKKSFRGA